MQEFTVRFGSREATVGLDGKINQAILRVPQGFDVELLTVPEGLAVTAEPSQGHEIGLSVQGAGKMVVYVDGSVRDAGVQYIEVTGLF